MILIGDVHGKFKQYKRIIKAHRNTIQVGDMGVGFKNYQGRDISNPPYDRMVEGDHRFIRGNHDNPSVCQKHSQWIPDGHVEGDVMFVGGALSIDREYRTEGYDYWKDEELSYKELDDILGLYLKIKPRIMVTHECPEKVAYTLNHRTYKFEYPSRTRQAFDNFFALHKPEIWVFGHWHRSFDEEIDGTRCICLNELEVKEIA